MEIINISPPWNTEIITNGNHSLLKASIEVKSAPNHTVFTHKKATGVTKTIAVYTMNGKQIWSQRSAASRIVWNHIDLHGSKVSSGMYLYQLRAGDITARGTVAVK
jgi:hypothetical protein